jgi:hypothetical protein
MSILKKFLEKNSSLLETMSDDNPELSVALLEALSVMGQFMDEKGVVFTEEQENAILQSTEPIVFEEKSGKESVKANVESISQITEEIEEKSKLTEAKVEEAKTIESWEFLRLQEVSDLDRPIKSNNFPMFWDAIKENYYNNDPSEIPTTGYDKLYINVKYFGAIEDYFFKKVRLDIGIGVSDYNPFTSQNIFFDERLRIYSYRLMYVIFGFGDIKSDFGDGTNMDYFISSALILFNFEMQVSKEYFEEKIVSEVKYYLNSDYWNEKMKEKKSRVGLNPAFKDSAELKSLYDKMGQFTDIDVKEMLRMYVPTPIYNYLFLDATLNRKFVYDLAWLTPNENGDLEYVKMQLGMPYDYEKAFGFQSAPAKSKIPRERYEVTNINYYTDNIPLDYSNAPIIKDIIAKVIRLSNNGNIRIQYVTENGENLYTAISYDPSDTFRPYTSVGDVNAKDSEEMLLTKILDFLPTNIKGVRMQIDNGKSYSELTELFDNLNNVATPVQKTISTPKKKVSKTKQVQHTHIQKDDLDLSDEDIKALESLGDLENEDLTDLDELIENI